MQLVGFDLEFYMYTFVILKAQEGRELDSSLLFAECELDMKHLTPSETTTLESINTLFWDFSTAGILSIL